MALALRNNQDWLEPYGVIVGRSCSPPVWPNDDDDFSVTTYERVLFEHGYQACVNGDFEEGYEKVCLYTDNNEVKHVARQLNETVWSSKLGICEDISHNSLDVLENGTGLYAYGRATHFYKREKE